jgi:NADPH:quinone reductase-like Zn-dependent oxidoreductase
MSTMKAVQIHQYGKPDVLTMGAIARPNPKEGDVLICVHAASINPVDWKTRKGGGIAGILGDNPFPLILGWDISGTVEAIGPGVESLAAGDEVYGMVGFPGLGNAYAEYVSVPVHEVVRKPANYSHTEAAGVPLVALTAWQALFEVGQLQAGQTILVHAAAGGVGHVAVQLAKWKGARVIGTASGKNSTYLRDLGVDTVIDYTTQAFEHVVNDVDVVLDTLGGDVQERSFQVLKRGGKLVSIVSEPNKQTAQWYGVEGHWVLVRVANAQLRQITGLIEEGSLRLTISRVLPLDEVQKAHELSESHHTRGKIVLQIV